MSNFSQTSVRKNRMNLKCPVCKTGLKEITAGRANSCLIDACPRCNGLWVDKGELDRLDESPWANVEDHPFHRAEGDHPTANCPRCKDGLTPVSAADYSDVIVDRCEHCGGFWLDANELDSMKEVAAAIDEDRSTPETDVKPAGWSDLRWRCYLLKKSRD